MEPEMRPRLGPGPKGRSDEEALRLVAEAAAEREGILSVINTSMATGAVLEDILPWLKGLGLRRMDPDTIRVVIGALGEMTRPPVSQQVNGSVANTFWRTVIQGLDLRSIGPEIGFPEDWPWNLDLSGLRELDDIGGDLRVGTAQGGYLDLRSCTNLQSLPSGLRVHGELLCQDCSSLVNVPDAEVDLEANFSGCDLLFSLPDGFKAGALALFQCPGWDGQVPYGVTSLRTDDFPEPVSREAHADFLAARGTLDCLLATGADPVAAAQAALEGSCDPKVVMDVIRRWWRGDPCRTLRATAGVVLALADTPERAREAVTTLANSVRTGGAGFDLSVALGASTTDPGLNRKVADILNLSGAWLDGPKGYLHGLGYENFPTFYAFDGANMECLPTGLLAVPMALSVKGCGNLVNLPYGFVVDGYLDLEELPKLKGLPHALRVGGDLHLNACPLQTLSGGLKVDGRVRMGWDIDWDRRFPEDAEIAGGVVLTDEDGEEEIVATPGQAAASNGGADR
jgi:hypothetical protein